ncbi:MAG: hypothetical protein LBT75_02185 [Bacilli bacterium]|jgi:hypothetical protein|nr:hypothetical protein [Bacilli bacterium]
MKNKKIIFYVIIIIVVVAMLSWRFYLQTNQANIQIYKPAAYDDCNKIVNEVNKKLILTNISNNNLSKLNINNDDYEASSCIKLSLKQYSQPLLVLDDYQINHKFNQNDQAYQLSYQEILNYLNKKTNKNNLDKQVIKALKYYLSNKTYVLLYPQSNSELQNNSSLIGPNINDRSGKYQLFVYLNILVNKNTKTNNVTYSFDSLSMKYVKVGELNE